MLKLVIDDLVFRRIERDLIAALLKTLHANTAVANRDRGGYGKLATRNLNHSYQ